MTPTAAPPPISATRSRPLLLPLALVVVAFGAAVVPVLGPLVLEVIDYHVSPGATDQIRGGDLAQLLLVGPVALAAAWRVRQRLPGGAALAVAPASYGLYQWTQVTVSGDLNTHPGNSERWFPLFWLLIVAAGTALVLAGAMLARDRAPEPSARLRRTSAVYLLVVAAFLVLGLHLPGLLDAWRDVPISEEYLADPVPFWTVKLMDLAIVVPVTVSVGIGLLRSRTWACTLLAPVLGWCALLAASVAGMGVVMWVTDAAGASAGLAAGFVVAAVGAMALAVAAYVPLLRRAPTITWLPDQRAARPDRSADVDERPRT